MAQCAQVALENTSAKSIVRTQRLPLVSANLTIVLHRDRRRSATSFIIEDVTNATGCRATAAGAKNGSGRQAGGGIAHDFNPVPSSSVLGSRARQLTSDLICQGWEEIASGMSAAGLTRILVVSRKQVCRRESSI